MQKIRKITINNLTDYLANYPDFRWEIDEMVNLKVYEKINKGLTPELASTCNALLTEVSDFLKEKSVDLEGMDFVLTTTSQYILEVVVANHINRWLFATPAEFDEEVTNLFHFLEFDLSLVRRTAELEMGNIEYYVREGLIPYVKGAEVPVDIGSYC